MVKQMYPKLTINLQYFKENVAAMVERCDKCGIAIAGVIKGTTGFPQCAQAFKEGGAKIIASSRLEQIEDTIEYGVGLPTMLLRIPMLTEVDEVVRLCDISLNSEVAVLKALNEAAAKQSIADLFGEVEYLTYEEKQHNRYALAHISYYHSTYRGY